MEPRKARLGAQQECANARRLRAADHDGRDAQRSTRVLAAPAASPTQARTSRVEKRLPIASNPIYDHAGKHTGEKRPGKGGASRPTLSPPRRSHARLRRPVRRNGLIPTEFEVSCSAFGIAQSSASVARGMAVAVGRDPVLSTPRILLRRESPGTTHDGGGRAAGEEPRCRLRGALLDLAAPAGAGS